MTIKTYKTAVRASAILAAIALSGGAFAGISESFEGKTAGDTLTTSPISALAGNGTYAGGGPDVAPGMGFPITNATHNTALKIAGTVTYTEGTTPTTKASQVDFMFKVEPTDELENPTGDDIRVALAVGTNAANTTTAPIKLWCKTTSGGSADWVDLAPAVTTGSWVRATLVLDYTDHKCSVSLNGDPALNGTDKWFYFANNGGDYVASITMVGSTMVDDLVVTHTSLTNYKAPGGYRAVADSGQGSNVTYEYINKYGVTVDQATNANYTCAGSGMTVAQKFDAGLDPTTDTKFELKTMQMTASTVTMTFPGTHAKGKYAVKVSTTKGGAPLSLTTNITKTDTSGENTNTAEVTIPAENQDDLLYFTVETVTP